MPTTSRLSKAGSSVDRRLRQLRPRTRRLQLTDDFDYNRFFALAEAFERSALRVNVVEPIDVDPWAVTRGEARIDVLRCECDEGRDALDLVGTTSAVLVLLSSRVIDAGARPLPWVAGPAGRDHVQRICSRRLPLSCSRRPLRASRARRGCHASIRAERRADRRLARALLRSEELGRKRRLLPRGHRTRAGHGS